MKLNKRASLPMVGAMKMRKLFTRRRSRSSSLPEPLAVGVSLPEPLAVSVSLLVFFQFNLPPSLLLRMLTVGERLSLGDGPQLMKATFLFLSFQNGTGGGGGVDFVFYTG